MTSTPRVIIIGAGIVGASLADELTARGWTDVTVLDAGGLPAAGGSSSHAPGVVFQTNGTKVMSDLARYTVGKFSALSWRGEPCYLPVGGLEIATSAERAAELQRRFGFAQSWGVPGARLLDAGQTARAFDLLDPEVLHGGLYVPGDGIAKSLRAIAAQLDRAAGRGATVRDHAVVRGITSTVTSAGSQVTGVDVETGGTTEHLAADIVVCCAGIWGQAVAGMVDMTLPLTPLAHQLARTADLPALAGATAEARRPVLRHQDADLYFREDHAGLYIGSYRHRPMPVSQADLAAPGPADPMPSVQPFTPQDFAFPLAESARILPATAGTELAQAINGIFSFTTDNLPLVGPHPSLSGFWVAEAVWVTHSAGVAAALAEWLVVGRSETFDLHGIDVNRFERHQLSPAYILAKDCQNFVEVYDIVHPLQPMEHSRPLRTSPFYPRQLELGAVFLEANGWERPHWYAANDDLVAGARNTGWHIPEPDSWASQFWSPTIAAEAAITRTDVALYDMTSLKRLEVTGPGATAFLQGMVTGNIARSVGSVVYCLLLDIGGRIRSDITVARLGPDRYQIGANGALDQDWLARHLAASGQTRAPQAETVQIRDTTAGTCCIGIWGPRARDVVQALTDTDFSHAGFGYFRAKTAYLRSVEVTALRVSYVGELGWELYTSADQGLVLWDLLMAAGAEHGIIAAGRGAFNSLRLEKGYRSFGTDMTHEHDPYQAGLAFAVKPGKGEFLGRDALAARAANVRSRLTLLTVTEPNGIALGSEPVYRADTGSDDRSGDRPVGYLTSAGYSYTLGTPLAYAWLPAELAEPGTELRIGYFDRRYPAVVTAEPAFDPDGSRIRC